MRSNHDAEQTHRSAPILVGMASSASEATQAPPGSHQEEVEDMTDQERLIQLRQHRTLLLGTLATIAVLLFLGWMLR